MVYFDLNNWLQNQARFVYYPTPPGEAGGLQECPADENDRHILRNNIRNIQASILTGSNFLETLRNDGRSAYKTEKTIAVIKISLLNINIHILKLIVVSVSFMEVLITNDTHNYPALTFEMKLSK